MLMLSDLRAVFSIRLQSPVVVYPGAMARFRQWLTRGNCVRCGARCNRLHDVVRARADGWEFECAECFLGDDAQTADSTSAE